MQKYVLDDPTMLMGLIFTSQTRFSDSLFEEFLCPLKNKIKDYSAFK